MSKNTVNIRGGHAYEAPSVELMDVVTEGVFCSSTAGIDPWEREDGSLDFE